MKKEAFLSWVEEGIITIPSFLFQYYKEIGLNDTECMVILQIQSFLEKGTGFPTHEEIAGRMTLSVEQLSQIVGSLIQRGYLEITKGKTDEGIYYEKYSLRPLWNRLIDHHILREQEQKNAETAVEEGNVFSVFEQEFARALSPIEYETITMWLDRDKHSPELIIAALREAVLSGKLNFRYIDRILFEWKRNGIKTVEQAKEHGRQFRLHQQRNKKQNSRKQTGSVPFYNWLEN